MSYRDLHLTIYRVDNESTYHVTVAGEGGDGDPAAIRSNFTVQPVPGGEGPARGLREVARAARKEQVNAAGRELFRAFVEASEETRKTFDRMVPGNTRIWIRANDPAITALPWETLQEGEETPFALQPSTPVLRRASRPADPARLRRRWRWRVLVVLASPADLGGLKLEEEKERLDSVFRWLVRLTLMSSPRYLINPTWEELHKVLGARQWDIVHFAGHGGIDAQGAHVYLCDEGKNRAARQGKRLPADALMNELRAQKRLLFTFFNSCHGADSAGRDAPALALEIVKAGVGAVLAMQGPIDDAEAIRLVGPVYRELARGGSLEAGVSKGRNLLRGDSAAWWGPALHMTDGLVLRVPWCPLLIVFLFAASVAATVLWLAVPPQFGVTVEAVCDPPDGCVEKGKSAPVANQAVYLKQDGVLDSRHQATGSEGKATFGIRRRSAHISVRRAGYHPFEGTVNAGDTITLCWRDDVCYLDGEVTALPSTTEVRWERLSPPGAALDGTGSVLGIAGEPPEHKLKLTIPGSERPPPVTLTLRDQHGHQCQRTIPILEDPQRISVLIFPRAMCEERCRTGRCNSAPPDKATLPASHPE